MAFCLPVFVLAGWSLRGWALGAVLWLASQALGILFDRIGIHEPTLRGSGVVAFGMMARGILVMLVAIAVAVSDPQLALAGALVYAAAYSRRARALARRSTSAGGRCRERLPARRDRGLRAAGGVRASGLGLDPPRAARHVDQQGGRLSLGRGCRDHPPRRLDHALRPLAASEPAPDDGEAIYELVQGQIAEGNLPSKAIGTWFPYVASLFLFIWVLNIVGFIPLPISNEHFHVAGVELPTWGIYAATANLSVTLALALITFFATHARASATTARSATSRAGSRRGRRRLCSPLIVPLEVISQFMRLISLSVRLFANMLAGHMLILVMLGLIFIFESYAIAVIAVPVATAVYIFEVAIVVTIQAFVFALLSAIYIGGAIEPEH